MTEPSSLPAGAVDELVRSAADRGPDGRGARTRALHRWRKRIAPNLPRGECANVLLLAARADDGDDRPASLGPAASEALLSVVEDDDGDATEGHRESAVEVLRELVRRAAGGAGVPREEAPSPRGDDEEEARRGGKCGATKRAPIELFRRCARTFQKRMAQRESSNGGDAFQFGHGTKAEPMESSEHIRLLLVELATELGEHCLAHSKAEGDGPEDEDEERDKMTVEATSEICGSLAKFTLLDPYPEVQRAACGLIETLARLCPLGVRMNAVRLLAPLTGRADDAILGAEHPSASTMAKKCLFRHRHAKTRGRAVDASVAIGMCCPRADANNDGDDAVHCPAFGDEGTSNDHLLGYGSRSASMEQILHDALLPGWEDLLRTDPAASVQMAVLKSLGKVAGALEWRHASNKEGGNIPSNTTLASAVEARVLSLFLAGLSAGNANQVRSVAVQQLSNLEGGVGNEQCFPRGALVLYFQPMLKLILGACSRGQASCLSKVRSLEALQVLLIIAIPLMEKEDGASPMVELPSATIRSIVGGLSENILSEEKEVMEAALACCRILGGNGRAGPRIVSTVASRYPRKDADTKSLVTGDGDNDYGDASVEDADAEDGTSATMAEESPRQMTSMLLVLDGTMKGSLCNEAAASILQEIDRELTIAAPEWFRSSPAAAVAISSFLCQSAIMDNVASNSSLAWALLDACDSFVQCVHQLDWGDGEEWELTNDVIVGVLIGIVYLLACPEEYGLSSHAMSILDSFSSFSTDAGDAIPSLMDIHFRLVFSRIVSSAPAFPWEQSDPAFRAMDALLRACTGATVASNFDMVAPFFISHLSTAAYSKNTDGGDGARDQSLKATASKDDLAEEYSLRISLMALLQTILSDEGFSRTLGAGPAFSAEFATDVLLSLVLPNLVWKVGGMASALRKLAAATLFSLLGHYRDEKGDALLRPETLVHLIPILHSNLEDTESTTRELCCVCLSMVLEQISTETFATIWETDTRVIDTLYPRLLELLDDSHDPVRIAACGALEVFLALAHATGSVSSYDLGLSSLENITSSLLIQLDDPDREIQEHAFQVLLVLGGIYARDKNPRVVDMLVRKIRKSLKLHRDGSFCRLLLDKVQTYEKERTSL